MKRQELIRQLVAAGCVLARHGAKHDVYFNPGRQRKAPVPRHAELADSLCRLIKKQLGLQ